MNYNTFSKLDLHGRAGLVFSEGDFISSIKYYAFNISLYILEDTYIEVFYNSDSNEIEDIEILDPEEKRLNLYAIGVDIKDLFIN